MAEFQYFATREESIGLVEDLLTHGALRTYVDTGAHDQPIVQPFTAFTEELRTLLDRWRRVYFFGRYSTHPPLLRQQQTGEHAGRYFQEETGGGPLITLTLARSSTEGPPTLIAGSLSTQPSYQLEPGRWEKPGPELRDAFTAIAKRLKACLVRHNGLWIGREALAQLQAGKVQLPSHLQTKVMGTPASQKPAKTRTTPGGSFPPGPPVPKAAQGG